MFTHHASHFLSLRLNQTTGRTSDMADAYKNSVFLVFDVEHQGNSGVHHPDPFAIGMCVAMWNEEQKKFGVVKGYKLLLCVEDKERTPDPAQVEWWTKNHPALYHRLTSGRITGKEAGESIVDHVYAIRQNLVVPYNRKLVLCADDPSDFHLLDCMLERHGFKWMRHYINPEGFGSTLDIDAWLEGRGHSIQTHVAEIECHGKHATGSASRLSALQHAASGRLSKDAVTEHQHTHDPLDDALHLAETFCWALNADVAAASQ